MRVADARRFARVVFLTPAGTLSQAAGLMRAHGVGLVVVMDAAGVHGVVTEAGLVAALGAGQALEAPVAAALSQDFLAADPDEEMCALLHRLVEHGLEHVLVMRNGAAIAVLTLRELWSALFGFRPPA